MDSSGNKQEHQTSARGSCRSARDDTASGRKIISAQKRLKTDDSPWRSAEIVCEPGKEDIVSTLIFDSGFTGVIETFRSGMVVYTAFWRSSPEKPDSSILLKKSLDNLEKTSGSKLASIQETEIVPEYDWETTWRKGLEAVEIGKKIVVKPSWAEYDNREKRIEILIDPKMAFGTGSHPTTRLCMEIAENLELEGKTVLDCGCGSGIISIACIKLGASGAFGFDNDPFSVENASENSIINQVEGETTFAEADLCSVEAKNYDLVFANIISGTLLECLGRFHEFCSEQGKIVFSGLLAEEEEYFIGGLSNNGFNPLEVRRLGEWIAVLAGRAAENI